jgi:hypothetical protein
MQNAEHIDVLLQLSTAHCKYRQFEAALQSELRLNAGSTVTPQSMPFKQ